MVHIVYWLGRRVVAATTQVRVLVWTLFERPQQMLPPFQHVVVGHVVFSHISLLTAVFAPPPPAQGSHHPTTAAFRFCFVRAQKQNVSDCRYKGLALPVSVVAN